MNNLKDNKNESSLVKSEETKIKQQSYWGWPVKIFFLAVALSLLFGVVSEHFMSEAGIVLAIIVVLLLISISVITDMIGVAVVACSEAPFKSMMLKKVRGAKQGLFIVKNAAKIASLCADVIGDVCGVLSGAAGATILSFLISNNTLSAYDIIIAAFISAIIAGLTIGGKALTKQYATKNATNIILIIGKFLSLFSKNDNK